MNEKDLNGKPVAREMEEGLKKRVEAFAARAGAPPRLVMVQVGEDPSAAAYVKSKVRMCRKLGLESSLVQLPKTASLGELGKKLEEQNGDPSVHGIILELPLPQHIPFEEAVSLISPCKDVDGLHPVNSGLLFSGTPRLVPNTPMAVMKLLDYYQVPLEGREVVIVGRSVAVGKPLIPLFLARNATVTTCHSRTRDLSRVTSRADVLVVSVGRPRLVTAGFVREGAVVVDVGINVTPDGLTGDVDYEGVYPVASRITPVPGGVGPITVAVIMENTLKAAEIQLEGDRCRKSLHLLPGK